MDASRPIRFKRDWTGLTAVVVGNGPSLLGTPADEYILPNTRHLVANGGYLQFPEADVLMCSDRHWLKAHPDLSGYHGPLILVTRPEAVMRDDSRMRYARREYIEKVRGDIFADPSLLVEGHNSTSTNISVAVLRGVSRIILVGIDLRPGANGRRRTYDHSKDDASAARARYDKQVRHLTKQSMWVKRRGIEVINCSPMSRLACYPYEDWAKMKEALRA